MAFHGHRCLLQDGLQGILVQQQVQSLSHRLVPPHSCTTMEEIGRVRHAGSGKVGKDTFSGYKSLSHRLVPPHSYTTIKEIGRVHYAGTGQWYRRACLTGLYPPIPAPLWRKLVGSVMPGLVRCGRTLLVGTGEPVSPACTSPCLHHHGGKIDRVLHTGTGEVWRCEDTFSWSREPVSQACTFPYMPRHVGLLTALCDRVTKNTGTLKWKARVFYLMPGISNRMSQ